MSRRQFEILFACLISVLWPATAAEAQLSLQKSPSQLARAQRVEPAPLRQGGFIQQLRAIPPSPAQILQETDERAFRLPARSPAPADAAIQQLPPTFSELQNRSALNRRLRGEHGRVPVAAAVGHSRVDLSLSDRSPVIDAEAVGSYRSDDPYIVAASNQSEPNSMRVDARSRLPAYELGEPKQGVDLPRNEAFDALTAEALQQAPRVSRVPLPRPAAVAKRSRESVEATPARIVATPASVTPHLGGTRASNAAMRTAISPDLVIPDVSGEAASGPSTPAPTLPQSTREHATPLELPSPPSSAPSRSAAVASQSNADLLPALPKLAESNPASHDVDHGESNQPPEMVTQMAMPSFGSVPPEATLSDTHTTKPPLEQFSHSLDNNLDNGVGENNDVAKAERGQLRTQTGGSSDRSSEADQRLKMEAPRLSVVLSGPGDLPIGAPADYQIVVRNQDSLDLNGLILRLDIPAGVEVQAHKPTHGEFELETAADGLTMVTWSFEHLAAGQTATAPLQLVAGSAKNFAVAMEWTLMPMAGASAIEVRAPQLELALEGPAEVRFGEPNVYRLRIRNPGNAPAEQIAVRLSAERFGSSTAEIAHIAPGEEEVIDVELTFNERGSINIEAFAKEHTGLASQTAIAVVVRQAMVESQLLTAPLVYHSALTECRVRLSNHGDADALGMQAVLQLPEGAGLVATPTGAVLKDRELTWPVDKLVAGSSEEFVVQLKLTAPGANALSLLCSGPGNVRSSAQAVTRVESITDLKLFVEAPLAPAPVGSEVVYELTLTNRGSKAATNVSVVAQFSDGIEPIRSEGQPARVVPGQALFETLPSLAAGQTVHLKVIAQAAAAGSHRFRVEVRSDDSQVRLVQEESTQYLESASRIAVPLSSDSALR